MSLHRLNIGTKIVVLSVAVLGLGASGQTVAEVEGSFVAIWYGIIENYAGDVPDPVLAIRDDGTCYWTVYIKSRKTARRAIYARDQSAGGTGAIDARAAGATPRGSTEADNI